jgi:hypothetical protein
VAAFGAEIDAAGDRDSCPDEDKEAEYRDDEESLHATQQGYQGAKASCTLFHCGGGIAQIHA